MDTELINILITAAVTLVSGGGVAAVAAVMYRKQNKRLKEAEATASELRNSLDKIQIKDKEREYHDNCIDDLHDSIDKMQKHFAEQTEQNISKDAIIKEKDVIIEDKTQHIRRINDEHSEEIARINKEHAAEVARLNEEKLELQRQLTGKVAYIGRLKLFIQWLMHWHCKRETGAKKGQCGRRLPAQDVPTPFREYPDKELVAELGGVTVCETVNGQEEAAIDENEND